MCGEYMISIYEKSFHVSRSADEDLCSIISARSYSLLSASRRMSENFVPSFVYQRRKRDRNYCSFWTIQPSTVTKPSDGCHSSISSVAPFGVTLGKMVSASELATESASSPVLCPVECNREASTCLHGRPNREEVVSEDGKRSDNDGALNVFCDNNCSSSKSNMDNGSGSSKIDMDDAGECSSSGALSAEKVAHTSEREICISIFRSQGLLDKVLTRKDRAFTDTCNSSNYCCSKICKVCEHAETTTKMLICDNCEDAFHVSCCNPRAARIPVGEWLCSSCLKKKHKLQKEKTSINASTEIGRNGYSTSEGELGSLEFMFKDTEPHMSNVRIGREFQASIPDWSCRMMDKFDIGLPIETDPSKYDDFLERNYRKPFKLSSIGNWLQCQESIEGVGEDVDGTICGKWRRAPLFENQTDSWECFDCILWDPAHADCAVPQELDTEEIMKQLKYVEMLRPRLAAKRRKLNCSKSNNDSQNLSRTD